jgi:hypothetical protein
MKMASEPNELGPVDPDNLPYPDYREVLSALPNAELLNALDLALLELEKRLLKYARVGPEVLGMADEGLVLAVRARARLSQALSSAQHAEGHLQVVGLENGSLPAPAPPGTPSRASPTTKVTPKEQRTNEEILLLEAIR